MAVNYLFKLGKLMSINILVTNKIKNIITIQNIIDKYTPVVIPDDVRPPSRYTLRHSRTQLA